MTGMKLGALAYRHTDYAFRPIPSLQLIVALWVLLGAASSPAPRGFPKKISFLLEPLFSFLVLTPSMSVLTPPVPGMDMDGAFTAGVGLGSRIWAILGGPGTCT